MMKSKDMMKPVKIKFKNNYHLSLDSDYEDKTRKKYIDVDMGDRQQLYNIIKKRKEYKLWQPDRATRRGLIRALEDLDIKEAKEIKEKREKRKYNA